MRRKAPKSEFTDALLLNDLSYNDYLQRMRKICLSMFEWKNLPKTMNARYLEMTLYYKGQAALLYDNKYGFINTRAVDTGYINIYGLPTRINCFSYQYNEVRDLYIPNSDKEKDAECILVMNNYERFPTASTIELFAARLSEAQRTADVNIKAQRTPILMLGDQKQIFTLKKTYEQYDGNSPVLYGDKNSLNPDMLRSIKTDAPFIANDILDYKREIWNEFLTFIGVQNLSEKRERLISSEADSNNELINLNMQSYLIPRQQACDEFNDKFGLSGDKAISVGIRSDLYNIIKEHEGVMSNYSWHEEIPEDKELELSNE